MRRTSPHDGHQLGDRADGHRRERCPVDDRDLVAEVDEPLEVCLGRPLRHPRRHLLRELHDERRPVTLDRRRRTIDDDPLGALDVDLDHRHRVETEIVERNGRHDRSPARPGRVLVVGEQTAVRTDVGSEVGVPATRGKRQRHQLDVRQSVDRDGVGDQPSVLGVRLHGDDPTVVADTRSTHGTRGTRRSPRHRRTRRRGRGADRASQRRAARTSPRRSAPTPTRRHDRAPYARPRRQRSRGRRDPTESSPVTQSSAGRVPRAPPARRPRMGEHRRSRDARGDSGRHRDRPGTAAQARRPTGRRAHRVWGDANDRTCQDRPISATMPPLAPTN